MNESLNSNQPPDAEIIKPTNGRVEVSGELLNEAVAQLRKLTEIRQRETERQERAIAQMQKAIKRQSILSRYVILTSTVAVLLSVGLAYIMRESVGKEAATASALTEASQTLEQQQSTLEGLRTEAGVSREMQAAMAKKVEEQMTAVREERDQVRGEVRTVLEEKTREYGEKELALAAERNAIAEAAQRSKEEQKALIQETIARLTAMSESIAPASQPDDTPTVAPAAEVSPEEQTIEAIAEAGNEIQQPEPPAEVPAESATPPQ